MIVVPGQNLEVILPVRVQFTPVQIQSDFLTGVESLEGWWLLFNQRIVYGIATQLSV